MLADIHSGVIFWLLPLDGLFMAISMYNLEHVSWTTFDLSSKERIIIAFFYSIQHQSASNLADWGIVGYGIICIICASAWPFLFCYFATLASERILTVGQTTFNSNWYMFPPELQKYLILIIARSQKPVYFNGFGLVHCTLETLAKVNGIF